MQCGALFTNTFKENKTFSPALVLNNYSNVQIYELTIEQSSGTGLMILDHQGGTVIKLTSDQPYSARINSRSQIQEYNNDPSNSTYGGGGVYIHLGEFPRHKLGKAEMGLIQNASRALYLDVLCSAE